MVRTVNYPPGVAPVWVSDTAKPRSACPKLLLPFAAFEGSSWENAVPAMVGVGFVPYLSSQQLNSSPEDCLAQQQVRPAKSLTSRLPEYQGWGTNHLWLSLQPHYINEQHCIKNYCCN